MFNYQTSFCLVKGTYIKIEETCSAIKFDEKLNWLVL